MNEMRKQMNKEFVFKGGKHGGKKLFDHMMDEAI